MVVAAMQDVDQHIRSSLGFSILPEVNSTSRPGESNQQPSNSITLALPLSQPPDFNNEAKKRNTKGKHRDK